MTQNTHELGRLGTDTFPRQATLDAERPDQMDAFGAFPPVINHARNNLDFALRRVLPAGYTRLQGCRSECCGTAWSCKCRTAARQYEEMFASLWRCKHQPDVSIISSIVCMYVCTYVRTYVCMYVMYVMYVINE